MMRINYFLVPSRKNSFFPPSIGGGGGGGGCQLGLMTKQWLRLWLKQSLFVIAENISHKTTLIFITNFV